MTVLLDVQMHMQCFNDGSQVQVDSSVVGEALTNLVTKIPRFRDKRLEIHPQTIRPLSSARIRLTIEGICEKEEQRFKFPPRPALLRCLSQNDLWPPQEPFWNRTLSEKFGGKKKVSVLELKEGIEDTLSPDEDTLPAAPAIVAKQIEYKLISCSISQS